MTARIFVGTAGWSLPRADQGRFASEGTHLVRYAQTLTGAEINSSFYRPHSVQLYCKWAAATPDGFRFSVKMPKTITHEKRLLDCEELVCAFLDQTQGLGDRLGCILVQLPPSLEYDASLAGANTTAQGALSRPLETSRFTFVPSGLKMSTNPRPTPF